MKTKTILLASILSLNLTIGFAQTFQWTKSMGSTTNDNGNACLVDGNSNVYSTGTFRGTADFDPGVNVFNLTSVGLDDVFISKFDATGSFLWAKSIGGASGDKSYSIATDVSGNVYITGYFQGTVDFDPGVAVFNLTSVGNRDVFLCKLDATGNFLWAKSMGGTGWDYSASITISGSGEVYTTGRFVGTVDFDPGAGVFNLSSTGSDYDVFISKLSAAGNFIWAQKLGGASMDYGNAIKIDGSGNVFVTGYFEGIADFDPGAGVFNLTAVGGSDVFICKLSAAGNFVWAKSVGGANVDEGLSVVIDGSDVYATGYFFGTVDFDPGPGVFNLTSLGLEDVFVIKLDAIGNYVYAKSIGGTSTDIGKCIAIDASGNIYTTGLFSGVIDVDPGVGIVNLTSGGAYDVFIQKLDAIGNFVWASTFGGPNSDVGNSTALDGSGNLYTTGYFDGIVDFDPSAGVFNLTSAGNDIFIHKMSQCSTPAIPINTTPLSNQAICTGNSTTLTASASGTINWFANSIGGVSLGVGTTFITPTLSAGTYTYYAEASTCTISVSRAAITVTSSVCTSIKDENLSDIKVNIYPNPSNGLFIIEANNKAELEITDMLGRIIYTTSLNQEKQLIELKGNSNGIYFIKIKISDNSSLTKKIIITN